MKAVRENPAPVYISLSLNYLVLTACQAPAVKNVDNTVDKSLKDGATQLTSYYHQHKNASRVHDFVLSQQVVR